MRISDWSSDVCSSDLGRLDCLRERIADVAAVALSRVVGVLAVPRPPCVLDAGADPVGVGHDLVEGQRGRRLRECGAGKCAGEREQGEAGEQMAHRVGFRGNNPAQRSRRCALCMGHGSWAGLLWRRSEEHTSELQSLMRISYAVFCLKKKTQK